MTVRQIIGEGFALCCAIMLGLAAGAVWLLPAVHFQRPLPWLAVPAGWLLAIAIRQWVHAKRWNAAWLAAFATLVACTYSHVLTVAVNLSAALGYGLIEVIRTAGLSMLLDLAHLAAGRVDVAWAVVGIAVAAATALRHSPAAPARRSD